MVANFIHPQLSLHPTSGGATNVLSSYPNKEVTWMHETTCVHRVRVCVQEKCLLTLIKDFGGFLADITSSDVKNRCFLTV